MTRVTIIAEAGVNHNGDLTLGKRLVEAAANAGADYVKFQSFSAARLTTVSAPKAKYQVESKSPTETQRDMLQKLELSEAMHEELLDHCRAMNIGFLSTAFDRENLDFLISLGVSLIKVPSGEITNIPYLRYIGSLGKKVLLSTGMSTLGEIENALNVLEEAGASRRLVTVLHCNSAYPTPMRDVNLNAMRNMGNAFDVEIGYSDHTTGTEVPIAAVAMGASIIEKHLTLNKELTGPDHRASLEPHEFVSMVDCIRNIEAALGDGVKRPSPSEIENKSSARKSLVAACNIKAGTQFTVENIVAKRPGTGIPATQWDQLMNRVASKNYRKDDLIEW